MADTVKTRILIISDTHCASLPKHDSGTNQQTKGFRLPLPKADLLIHCGDLTYTGRPNEYEKTLNMLKQIDAPVKLVIAGNHDLSLDRDFIHSHHKPGKPDPDTIVNAARDFWTSPSGRARKEGVTYLDEGMHRIPLPNGAIVNVYASPYTPEFKDWGFPYERDEDRFNSPGLSLSDAKNIAPYPVPSFSQTDRPVDLLVTHGPPFSRLDQTRTKDMAGCPHLLRALMRARPLVHCFGHIHEGWGAEVLHWGGNADEVSIRGDSIATWTQEGQGGYRDGVKGAEAIESSLELAAEKGAVFEDISKDGRALVRGESSLLVNAAIMDIDYKPVNAPWIVDLDLPRDA